MPFLVCQQLFYPFVDRFVDTLLTSQTAPIATSRRKSTNQQLFRGNTGIHMHMCVYVRTRVCACVYVYMYILLLLLLTLYNNNKESL